MKKFLLLLLFASPFICKAQSDTSNYQKKIAYCTVEITQFGSKYFVSIDDGTKTKASDMEVKDNKGKQIKFASRIAVIDNMTRQGWTLVSSYYKDDKYDNTLGLIFERPGTANK